MTKAFRDYLKDQVVVFDIDGVLASYEFSHFCHSADIWEEAFISADNNPYCEVGPLPALQEFIKEMPAEHVFVCSVADEYEKEAKQAFVLRHYPIEASHIAFVEDKTKKVSFLEELSQRFPDKAIALVDDTVKTLDQIHSESNFVTVHITSFFD
ncbi:MAG: hypothetical protein ACI4BI_05550 [Anaerotardibacter sp.]